MMIQQVELLWSLEKRLFVLALCCRSQPSQGAELWPRQGGSMVDCGDRMFVVEKVSISKDSESPTKKYKISPSSIQPTFFWVKIVSGCFLRAVKVWEEKSEQRPFQLIGCCATGLGGKTAESETTIGIYHQSLSFQVMVCHGIPPLLDLWFSISLFFSLVFGAGRRWWWRWWWWRTAHSTTNSWSSGCHWDRSSNKNTSRFQKPIKKWCTRLQVDWWIVFFVPGFLEKTHF